MWVAQAVCIKLEPASLFLFFVVGTKGMKSNFLFWIHMGIPSPTESPTHKIGGPTSYAYDFVKGYVQMFQ
jgi:hypothetical protein